MDTGLRDKSVFITGASGGIGRELAVAFAAEDCRLVLHGHTRASEMAAWLGDQPFASRAVAVDGDVSDAAAMDRAVRAGEERFGRLDVCVANAGAWPPEDVPLARMDPARFVSTVASNLLGAAWTARAFLASVERHGARADGHGASLLFIGSTAGRFGERAHCDYAAAKAGLTGLVHSLKHEIVDVDPWGRVNMLEPGWTVTRMARPALSQPGALARIVATMPLRQVARAKDIARVAVSLSAPLVSRHVTGQIVTVAGGMDGRIRWTPDEVDEDAIRARLARD